MPSFAQRVTSTPIGQAVFHRTVKPLLNIWRSVTHPGIPADHAVVGVTCNGQALKLRARRNLGSDRRAIRQVFDERQYDFPVGVHGAFIQRRYEDIVASGLQPLIVDCGANIGVSVRWFAARYPKAHIVAVEPEAGNFAILKLNTEGLDVDLLKAGIGPADGKSHLDATTEIATGMGCRVSDSATGPAIEIMSIASILKGKPSSHFTPFILKVDIEGAEHSLFDGDACAMDRFPLIVMEPHDWMFPGTGCTTGFFRFHAAAGREFCMKGENVASVTRDPSLMNATTGFLNTY